VLVWERPYASNFVEWCMQRGFAVALWSSGARRNIDPIVTHVLPKRLRSHLLFVWSQEECTVHEGKDVAVHAGARNNGARKPLLLKELRHVWRRWPAWGPQSTVLVDDDPLKCERNPPHTAIHPAKWCALRTPPGAQLELAPGGALPTYLDGLLAAPDTQAHMAAAPYVAPAADAADGGAASDED
jgi:hypothetical protein